MDITRAELAKLMDHTLLKPEATASDIDRVATEAAPLAALRCALTPVGYRAWPPALLAATSPPALLLASPLAPPPPPPGCRSARSRGRRCWRGGYGDQRGRT